MSFSGAKIGIKSSMDFSIEKSLTFLRSAAQALFDENVRLRARIAELEGRAHAADEANTVLAEIVARQQHKIFGKSTERKGRGGASKNGDKPPAEPQTGHGPRDQAELGRKKVPHELPEDKRVCPCCGGKLVPMAGQVERSEIVSVTDKAFVMEDHEQQKYCCGGCNAAVVTAPGPKRLVPGGRYSPYFAIEVAIAKYADHLPLARQVHIMKRDGLRIDSQTLWDQLDLLADYLAKTYEAIIAEILACPVIQADETRWYLMAGGRTTENKTFQAWGLLAPDLVAYRILDSRSKEAGKALLADYKGIVMADGYTVYQSLAGAGDFVVANCWSHARRKYIECEENYPEEAAVAIDLIKQIYAVEREATDETRAQLRAEKSRPIVDKLMDWAREQRPRVLPRSGIAEALGYMLNLEEGLRRYLDDARIPIDNNALERALRGIALGRKNHYGSRSRRGTEVAAIMYTLIESAKLAGVSPRAYLRAVVDMAMQDPRAVLTPASFKKSQSPIAA